VWADTPGLAGGMSLRRGDEAALPDPGLVEQGPISGGFLVVPGPGGDEYGWSCVLQWDPGRLVGDDAVDSRPQLPGGGGIGWLLGLRLSSELVDVRVAVLGGVERVGRIPVKGLAG